MMCKNSEGIKNEHSFTDLTDFQWPTLIGQTQEKMTFSPTANVHCPPAAEDYSCVCLNLIA